ncbi:MAG: hypothetical protein QW101_07560 [Ignisphaera sp.]
MNKEDRIRKYEKTTNIGVSKLSELKNLMDTQLAKETAKLKKLEQKVSDILNKYGISASMRIGYINFARTLFRASKSQSSLALRNIIESELSKYSALSLNPDILNEIAKLLQLPVKRQIVFFDDFNEMPSSSVYNFFFYIHGDVYVDNSLIILPPDSYFWGDKTFTLTPPFSFEVKFLFDNPSEAIFIIEMYILTIDLEKYIGMSLMRDTNGYSWALLGSYNMPHFGEHYAVLDTFPKENIAKLIVSQNNAKLILNDIVMINIDDEFTEEVEGILDVYFFNHWYNSQSLKVDYVKVAKL